MDVALVVGPPGPRPRRGIDAPVARVLEQRGARVHTPSWQDRAVDWSAFDVAVVRTGRIGSGDREDFLAWAAATTSATELWNPAEVLRWNTHRSYLLELEDRGAPVIPTAWLARGDRVDLADLLASRGWSRAIVRPAVGVPAERPVAFDRGTVEHGQRQLDRLLATGDATVQPYLSSVETRGGLRVVLIDGEVSHAFRRLSPPGASHLEDQTGQRSENQTGQRFAAERLDRDIHDLARWVVQALGTRLLDARLDLLDDEGGTAQLVGLEATGPDLHLDLEPEAAERFATAILRRC